LEVILRGIFVYKHTSFAKKGHLDKK